MHLHRELGQTVLQSISSHNSQHSSSLTFNSDSHRITHFQLSPCPLTFPFLFGIWPIKSSHPPTIKQPYLSRVGQVEIGSALVKIQAEAKLSSC